MACKTNFARSGWLAFACAGVVLGVVMLASPRASAWTGALQTNYGGLAGWKWIDKVKELNGYNVNSGKYVVFNTSGYPYDQTPQRQFLLATAASITFTTVNGTSKFCTGNSTQFGVYVLNDIYNGTGQNMIGGTVDSSSITGSQQSNGTWCFGVNASGVSNGVTSLAYTDATFTTDYTGSPIPVHSITVPDPGCSALDIGCWMGNLGTAIGSTIDNVSKAILAGIAWLFAPDGNKTQADFSDLNTFLQDKLGFLVYPLTFMVNLFNAFSSSSSWCNSSSCTKSFGNLFGHDFTLNLNQLQTTMPTLWAWFLGLVRGIVVLELILAMRRKYKEVMQG